MNKNKEIQRLAFVDPKGGNLKEIKKIIDLQGVEKLHDQAYTDSVKDQAMDFFEDNKTLVYAGAGILAYLLFFRK